MVVFCHAKDIHPTELPVIVKVEIQLQILLQNIENFYTTFKYSEY